VCSWRREEVALRKIANGEASAGAPVDDTDYAALLLCRSKHEATIRRDMDRTYPEVR
jgi:hypothetical protein